MDPVYQDALQRFENLLDRAKESALEESAAATLATVDDAGHPAARTVLLRQFDKRGFVFFTNSLSDKGRQLAATPHAALCFYWDPLAEQVRVIQHRAEAVDGQERRTGGVADLRGIVSNAEHDLRGCLGRKAL